MEPPPRMLRARVKPLPTSRHRFQKCGAGLVCERCLAMATSRATARKREITQECPGSNAILAAALKSDCDYRHDLVLASFHGQPVVACIRCGAHSTRRVEKLMAMCLGPPARDDRRRGLEALQRLRQWMHPDPRFNKEQADAIHRLAAGTVGELWLPAPRR